MPFGFLQKVDSQNLLTFIIDEHPQTIALILCHLPAAQAADVISGLPAERQLSVVRRVATMENVADHIDHVCQLAGSARHSAIGTDLDGGFGIFTHTISQRISACCEIITAQGYPLSLDDVLAVNPRFPSLASLIFATQGKGHADSWEAGYRLVMSAWRQVRACRFEIGRVIETIHTAGGVAVLAHPAAIARQGGAIVEIPPAI